MSNDKEEPTPVTGIHDQETLSNDAYIDMELGIPRGEDNNLMHAMVKQRKLDDDGNRIGTEGTNPLFDTWSYEIEFIR